MRRFVSEADMHAFDLLYQRHYPTVIAALNVRLHRRTPPNKADAEDIAQMVFVRLIEKKHQFDSSHGSFKSWLFAMAYNAATDWERSAFRWSRISNEVLRILGRHQEPPPPDPLDSILNHLSGSEREIVDLYLKDLTLDKISGIVGLPRSTVHRRFRSAVEKMKSLMSNPEKEFGLSATTPTGRNGED